MKRKIRCVGWLSLSAWGLLTLAMLNPSLQDSSYATCATGDTTEGCVSSVVRAELNMTTSTVISLTMDSQVEMEITPKANGATGVSTAKVGVATNSSEGYAVYLKAGSSDGALRPVTSNIAGEISNTTQSQVTLSELETNSYGYALTTTPVDNTTTYANVPVEGRVIKTTDAVTVGTGDYAYGDSYYLSFGTKVGTSLPAGTYAGSVILSVVANPTTLRSMHDITYMQEMTSDLCEATGEHYTKQLIDNRDGKSYWVAKLKDGNCWMVQNLALDLSTEKPLTPEDSDVKEEWVPGRNTQTVATNTSQYFANFSYNLGEYLFNPEIPADTTCNITSEELSECPVFIKVAEDIDAYDTHYLIGNYYQWHAVVRSGESEESICAKGWGLPQHTAINPTYQTLASYYLSIKPFESPLYFTVGGYFSGAGTFNSVGKYGLYWTSSVLPNTEPYHATATMVGPLNYGGHSAVSLTANVRCLAK